MQKIVVVRTCAILASPTWYLAVLVHFWPCNNFSNCVFWEFDWVRSYGIWEKVVLCCNNWNRCFLIGESPEKTQKKGEKKPAYHREIFSKVPAEKVVFLSLFGQVKWGKLLLETTNNIGAKCKKLLLKTDLNVPQWICFKMNLLLKKKMNLLRKWIVSKWIVSKWIVVWKKNELLRKWVVWKWIVEKMNCWENELFEKKWIVSKWIVSKWIVEKMSCCLKKKNELFQNEFVEKTKIVVGDNKQQHWRNAKNCCCWHPMPINSSGFFMLQKMCSKTDKKNPKFGG